MLFIGVFNDKTNNNYEICVQVVIFCFIDTSSYRHLHVPQIEL